MHRYVARLTQALSDRLVEGDHEWGSRVHGAVLPPVPRPYAKHEIDPVVALVDLDSVDTPLGVLSGVA